MDLTALKLDLSKEIEGIWFSIDKDTELCIARMHNPNFNKLFEKLANPYRQSARKGFLADEKADEIMNRVIAETVLLDWKGLKSDGKNVPYSVEKAIEILSNPQLSSFKELVVDISSTESNYRNEEIQETEKKSENTSSGKKSGENK
jgi:hypothetical protein